MLSTTSSTLTTTNTPSYIVAASTSTTTTSPTIEPPNINAPQTLSDIKLICVQRKKKSKRHICLTFVESRSLLTNEQPCIEITRKSNTTSSSSQQSIYFLNECISFEYFDTVKNDFQAFIYVYFESYTISIFFSEENFEKKSLIIKHLEFMHQSKNEKSNEINNNSTDETNPSNGQGTQNQTQGQQQTPILPCASTTEQIIHTFDVNLISYGPIIYRDHALVGPTRLYFTTTDLYIASIDCNRTDLKVTITNQCPSKDKTILCIPYFTIKNYGNRSNIFLIELGKSNYGNGEIHMKCLSSSLASTIHLLVSPVIEERPLILSSAFQNQLLTNKRIQKSKNIQPPVQLSHEPTNSSPLDATLGLLTKKTGETSSTDSKLNSTTTSTSTTVTTAANDLKSGLLLGFFRTLSKNVSHLRKSATFHHQQSLNNDNNSLTKSKIVDFHSNDKSIPQHQHPIVLPQAQKKSDTMSSTSSNLTKQTDDTLTTSVSTITVSTTKPESTMGTYIDMGPTVHKQEENIEEKIENKTIEEEPTATADIGVNTTISLSPYVRSAIIVGNAVHLIADEKTLPIGPRSFTSPASVMQPFKTQLNNQNNANPYTFSTDLITSSPNSLNSLQQANSISNSEKSLLLSYGVVTFKTNDLMGSDQTERPISPPFDSLTIDQRLNSDLSLASTQQPLPSQSQGSTIYSFDNTVASSTTHIIRAYSISGMGDTVSGQIRASHGSILLFDEHLPDQTTTYLLGAPPSNTNEDALSTNMSRLSSFNLTTSISRPHLSNIDEERAGLNDAYALVEPMTSQDLPLVSASILLKNSTSERKSSVNYADLLLPTNENFETNDHQQIDHHVEENHDDNNINMDEKECPTNDLSTSIYTDIDFHQTQRRDRILQSAAKAKKEDQTPPFVL